MKRRLMTTLAIVVAVLMVITCGAITVMAATADETQAAAGKVARIGAEGAPDTVYYSSLTDAYNAAQNGATITVIKDTSGIPETITKTITLTSENGSKISNVKLVKIGVANGASGNLTIAGNLKIYATQNDTFQLCTGKLNIENDAYLELSNNTIINSGTSHGSSPVEININGGTIQVAATADNYGLIGIYRNNCTVNITGGKLIQNNGRGRLITIAPSTNSKVNISGGELTNAGGGIIFTHNRHSIKEGDNTTDNGCQINISGGKLTGAGDDKGLINVCHNYVDINISGGTLTTTGNKLIFVQGGNTDINISDNAYIEGKNIVIYPNSNTNVTITGGTVHATTDSTIYLDGKSNVKVNISGGTVSADHTAIKDVNTNSNCQVNISGTANVTSKYMTIATYGSGLTYNISGGTISSVNDSTLYIDKSNNVYNISGGTITAPTEAIKDVNTNKGSIVYISENANITAGSYAISSKGTGYKYNISGGTISGDYITVYPGNNSEFNISGGTISANNDSALYVDGTKTVTVNMTGGKITAPKETVKAMGTLTIDFNITGGTIEATTGEMAIRIKPGTGNTTLDISDNARITAKEGYGVFLQGTVPFTMTGGTVEANAFTVTYDGGENVANISGGTIIAREQIAINTMNGGVLTANISDAAKLYAGKKVFTVKAGQTINISGGLIDVANTYPMADDAYGIVMEKGTLNVTGGTFILGGNCNYAQLIYQEAGNTTATSTVTGGLFVNKNTANTVVFGRNVNYISGRVIYGNNIEAIRVGVQAAPKSVQVLYGDDLYYFFTKFEGADEFELQSLGITKFDMLDGAEVRLTKDSSGIRFTTQITEIEGATYGTIILPARYLANLSKLTLEELNAKGIKYENIVATEAGMSVAGGIVTINAALTNILPENYNTPFAAIAYVIIDGQYYYTTFDVEDNVRAVSVVAQMALDDVQNTKDDKYKYETKNEAGETVYSPYASSHRETLQGFVVASFNLTVPANASLMNVGNGATEFYANGVSVDAYNAYKASIEGMGFTQPSEMAIL